MAGILGAYGKRRPADSDVPYRIRLSCGHAIRTRTDPISGLVRYVCTHGQGCGYRLQWVEWWLMESPDLKNPNKHYTPERKEEVDGDQPSQGTDRRKDQGEPDPPA